jgi:hypothetical protein
MSGVHSARWRAVSIDAHRSFCAERASARIWRSSAACDMTTRMPLMFSSTIVATSAVRACTTHDSGKTRLRSAMPAKYTPGIVDSATSVSSTWMRNMNANAMRNVSADMSTSGPNASSSWIDRMSLFARLITWPDCVRSK